jgi:uncharacterized protein (DUF983 family)
MYQTYIYDDDGKPHKVQRGTDRDIGWRCPHCDEFTEIFGSGYFKELSCEFCGTKVDREWLRKNAIIWV